MKYQLWLDNCSGLGTSKKNHIINDNNFLRRVVYVSKKGFFKNLIMGIFSFNNIFYNSFFI